MQKINLENIKKVHFIGIGGIGMSGLARLFLHEGKEVSGSDRAPSAITGALEQEGVIFFPSQSAENISSRQGLELVVYTEAMSEDHPEMVAAREMGVPPHLSSDSPSDAESNPKKGVGGVPMMNYFEALALVANQYYLIAVAGTHGKTTTTAMLIDILEEAGLDPTAIVGSLRVKTKSNFRAGESKYFVVEADEYRRNFQHFEPDVLIITNIDHDHVDYYKDLTDMQSAFHELARKVPKDGVVIAQIADKQVAPVLEGLTARVIDYKPEINLSLTLTQPGLHNRMNAAAATAAAKFLGVEQSMITAALENFAGTWRRFEYKGDVNNAPVYDDYAHNPQKVAAAIAGVKEKFPNRKLTVVFQPHTYSRTKAFFDEFVTTLSGADRVVMVPIYAAREKDEGVVSSEQIVTALTKMNVSAEFFHTLEAAALSVKESVGVDDVVLVCGAGDVIMVSEALTQ